MYIKQDLLQCPCCDYFTLNERRSYEICSVCFWEDDGLDINNLEKHSGPNHQTLKEGRANFLAFGACDEQSKKNVVSKKKREQYKVLVRETK